MNVSSTPPQATTPQRAKESKDDEEEGEDPVKELSPKMKIAQMLFDFGIWAYPQQTLDDSVEDKVLGQLVDEHVVSLTPM